MMNDGFWLRIGAVWGFLAVAMGAFGAHGLKDRLTALDQTRQLPHRRTVPHVYISRDSRRGAAPDLSVDPAPRSPSPAGRS